MLWLSETIDKYMNKIAQNFFTTSNIFHRNNYSQPFLIIYFIFPLFVSLRFKSITIRAKSDTGCSI